MKKIFFYILLVFLFSSSVFAIENADALYFWNLNGDYTEAVTGKYMLYTKNSTSFVSAIDGQGVDIDPNEYLYNASIPLPTAKFSLSFWVNLQTTDVTHEFLTRTTGFYANPFDTLTSAGTGDYWFIYVGNGVSHKQNYFQLEQELGWYMLTYVYDGSRVYIYQNTTIKLNASTTAQAVSDDVSKNFRIGERNDGNGNSNYIIDLVGVYNTTLNYTDVVDLYNNGLGLAYPFDSAPVVPSLSLQWNLTNNTENYNKKNLTIYYNGTVLNANSDIVNCTIFVNGILNSTVTNINISTTQTFVYDTLWLEGNRTFLIYCNNSEINDTIGAFRYNIDTIPPVIYTDLINNTNLIQGTDLVINVTFTDLNLYAYNITIFDANGNVWNGENYFTVNATKPISENITTRSLTDTGIFTLDLWAWDSHTNNKVRELNWFFSGNDLIADNILFEGNLKELNNKGKTVTYFYLDEDRYKLKVTFENSAIEHIFNISASGWVYVGNTYGYKGHFVNLNRKRWLDFEGKNINNVDVVLLSNGKYQVTVLHDTETDEVEFESIGDLNEWHETYIFTVNDQTVSVLQDLNDTVNNLNSTINNLNNNVSLISGGVIMMGLVFLAIMFVLIAMWSKVYQFIALSGIVVSILGTQMMDLYYNYNSSTWYKDFGIGILVFGIVLTILGVSMSFIIEKTGMATEDRQDIIQRQRKKKQFYDIYR